MTYLYFSIYISIYKQPRYFLIEQPLSEINITFLIKHIHYSYYLCHALEVVTVKFLWCNDQNKFVFKDYIFLSFTVCVCVFLRHKDCNVNDCLAINKDIGIISWQFLFTYVLQFIKYRVLVVYITTFHGNILCLTLLIFQNVFQTDKYLLD